MKSNSKKKIAILYSGGRNFGGIEQYMVNLFNNVDKSDVDLELISLGKWSLTERLQNDGYKATIFSAKRISPQTISLIGKYLKEQEFDLLVSQGTVANAYARLVSLIYKVPNLVTVHSTKDGDYSNPLIRTTYNLIEKMTRFPTKKYIVVSNYLREQVIKSGVSAKKIDVIYNGLDFPNPKPKGHKRLIIGSVGRLHPVKGYDLLIDAFSQLDNKRLRLKIAGSGEELENLKKLALDLGVVDRVEFVGFQKDVYKFLDTLDIYVQSSRSEGFGLAVVEAMSQNLPVAVTPAGSLNEIVKNGKTGIISDDFSPKSLAVTISELVDNYESSRLIGENARDFVVRNFNITDWANKTIKAYKEAIR